MSDDELWDFMESLGFSREYANLQDKKRKLSAKVSREYRQRNKEKVSKLTAAYAKAHPEKRNAWQNAWNKKNPLKRKHYKLKHKYGIGLEEFNKMKEIQEYLSPPILTES